MGETITISREEYNTLIQMKGNIECVKRFLEKDGFISNQNLAIILGIELKEEK